jgi:membrane associated rhomboid family serine protease
MNEKLFSGFFLYIQSVIPLILAHFSIPPLSFFRGENFPLLQDWYSILPKPLRDENFIFSLILKDSQRGTMHPSIMTSIFVHYNFTHLLQNVQSLFFIGNDIFQDFGSFGLYGIFFLGGVLCSFPFEKYYDEIIKWSQTQITRPRRTDLFTALSSSFSDIWYKLPSIRIVQNYYCGSSGGICALMGASFASDIFKFYQIAKVSRISRRYRKSDYLFELGWISFRMLNVIGFLHNELQSLKATNQSGLPSFFSFMFQPSVGIGHMAHLQGFGIGFVASTIVSLFKS